MKTFSIEDLQRDPSVLGATNEVVEITYEGERVGYVNGADAFPMCEWEIAGDADDL